MERWRAFRKVAAAIMFFSIIQAPLSAKKKNEKSAPKVVTLALPERKNVSFFGSIDSRVMSLVEYGSPESLREAYSLIRRNNSAYSDAERVLIYIIEAFFELCWQRERIPGFASVNVDDLKANPYVGSVMFAYDGVYDTSAGVSDFFSFILPSLVLAGSSSRDDYYADAESALSAALEKSPGSVIANYLYGVLCRRTGRDEDAVAFFRKAEKAGTFEVSFALASSLYGLGRYDEAWKISSALVSSEPYDRNVLKLCAENSFALGNLDDAEEFVAKVLQQEPDNASYMLFRARILMEKGDNIRAASILDVYARTDSKSRDYLLLRSKIQKDWNRNVRAATTTIETALSLYPDDPEVMLAAARLASDTGGRVLGLSAGDLAAMILSMRPDDPDARRIQVGDFVQRRMWSDAYPLSAAIVSGEKCGKADVFAHIKICLALGKSDEAWNLVTEIYGENPSDEDNIQSYLTVLVAMSKRAEATELIGKLLASGSPKMKSFAYYQKSFIDKAEDQILNDLRLSLTSNPRNKDSLFKLYQIYYRKKEFRKAQYYLKQVVALSPTDEELLSLNASLDLLLKGDSK